MFKHSLQCYNEVNASGVFYLYKCVSTYKQRIYAYLKSRQRSIKNRLFLPKHENLFNHAMLSSKSVDRAIINIC